MCSRGGALGLTESRITQITGLLGLSPDVQELVLLEEGLCPGGDPAAHVEARSWSSWQRAGAAVLINGLAR